MASLKKLGEISYSPWELVLAIGWSPSGDLLAVAAGDKVHLVSSKTLQEQALLPIGAWANSLVFLPPGDRWLALAAKDGSWQLWDTVTRQQLCRVVAHPKGATSVATSSDGRLLASTGNDAIVRLWDISGVTGGKSCPGKPVTEMIGGAYAVSEIQFSPDGKSVASVDAHNIRLREASSGRLIRTLWGEASIFGIAYQPNGLQLASAETGGAAHLWDVKTGEMRTSLTMPGMQTANANVYFWRVAFNPNGDLLAGAGSDGAIALWDVSVSAKNDNASGSTNEYRLKAHHRAATNALFSPDGRLLATGGLDSKVYLWGVVSGEETPQVNE